MPYDGPLGDLRIHFGVLILRPPRAGDVDALMDVYDDDFNLVPQPRPTTERAVARDGILNRIARNPHARRDKSWGLDLIVETKTHPVVGWASLEPDDDLPGRQVESTTWVAPPLRRRGHATNVRHALLAFAFNGLAATHALSRAQPSNEGSNNVSISLGYTLGNTTYTSDRIAYQNWSLAKAGWEQADKPGRAKLTGYTTFRDWLDSSDA